MIKPYRKITCKVSKFKYYVIKEYKDRGTTLLQYVDKGSGNDPDKVIRTTIYTKKIKNGEF